MGPLGCAGLWADETANALDLPPVEDSIVVDEDFQTDDLINVPFDTEMIPSVSQPLPAPALESSNATISASNADSKIGSDAAITSTAVQSAPETVNTETHTMITTESSDLTVASPDRAADSIGIESASDQTGNAIDNNSDDQSNAPSAAQKESELPTDSAFPSSSPLAEAEEPASPSSVEAEPAVSRRPRALLEQLEPLLSDSRTQSWGKAVQTQLNVIGDSLEQDDTVPGPALNALFELYNSGLQLGKQLQTDPVCLPLFRVCFGIKRRYSVWNLYSENDPLSVQSSVSTSAVAALPSSLSAGLDADLKQNDQTIPPPPSESDAPLSRLKSNTDSCARQLLQLLGSNQAGKSWIQFMHLDEFAAAAVNTQGRKLLLIQVLSNLNSPLSVDQAAFMSDRSIVRFSESMQKELRQYPVSVDILACLEQFELSPNPWRSEQLGMALLEQKLSGGKTSDLTPYLENSYRNANIRFDVSQKLLNRLAPPQTSMSKPVNDIIMNRHVRGSSITHTRPQLRLIPDPAHFQAVIDLDGSVLSTTVTNESGITFQQQSNASFHAQLPIILSVRGIETSSPRVSVNNRTRLQSVRTGVDIIPIVGSIVQEAARSQHQQYSSMASSEVEQKIAAQVRQELSAQTQARFDLINQNWEQKIGKTLKRLGIEIAPIDAQTNVNNATLRFRVAGHDQLGASTPRPKATDGALLNLQIHDSICNNVVQRLDFNGKRFQPRELRDYIAHKLNIPLENKDIEGEDRLTLTFAQDNPVWIHFDDDCLIVELSFAEILLDDRSFEDIKVLVKYVSQSQGMDISLERKDVVQIIGRCGIGKQITLRTIFSKVFSLQQNIKLVPPAVLNDSRWNGVGVTQFDMTDGWMAVTLGESEGSL